MLSRWWPLGEPFGSTHRRCKQACVLRCLGEVGGCHFQGPLPGFQALLAEPMESRMVNTWEIGTPGPPPGLCFRAPPTARVKYKGCLFSSLGGPGESQTPWGFRGAVPFPTADWLGLVTLTVPCGQSPRAACGCPIPGQGPSGTLPFAIGIHLLWL